MRFKLLSILLLVAFIADFTSAEKLPARKPGLWQISMSGAGVPPGQASKQCIDEKTDEEMIKKSSTMANSMGGSCNEPIISKEGNAYSIVSDCTFSGSKMHSVSTFNGDFSSQYEAATNVTYDPPLMGHSKSEMKFTATWLGKCEAGQSPGDIILPNGMKININSMGEIPKMPAK